MFDIKEQIKSKNKIINSYRDEIKFMKKYIKLLHQLSQIDTIDVTKYHHSFYFNISITTNKSVDEIIDVLYEVGENWNLGWQASALGGYSPRYQINAVPSHANKVEDYPYLINGMGYQFRLYITTTNMPEEVKIEKKIYTNAPSIDYIVTC